MKLARASRMHIPIRDLLLLGVNILLGDRQSGRILLTCRTAKNRADKEDYHLTNPYTNVFGMNLSGRQRQQYQVFNILEAFGIGRETNNKFDNLLIYGAYSDSNIYTDLVSSDAYWFFVTSCGFGLIEQAAHRTADQVDHRDEVGLVPVATCA